MDLKNAFNLLIIPNNVTNKAKFRDSALLTIRTISENLKQSNKNHFQQNKSKDEIIFKSHFEISFEQSVEFVYILASYCEPNDLWWWTNKDISVAAQACLFYLSVSTGHTKHSDYNFLASRLPPIVEKFIKPAFKLSLSQNNNQRNILKEMEKLKISEEYSDTQLWKSQNKQCVPTFSWIIKNINSLDLDQQLFIILPAITNMVDDYDIMYKLVGIELVNIIIQKVPTSKLEKTGIIQLFSQSIENLLVLRKEKAGEKLLVAGMKTFAEIVKKRYKTNSPQYLENLWKLVSIGIVKNFVYCGGNFIIQKEIFDQVIWISELLGVCMVRYMTPVLKEILDVCELECLVGVYSKSIIDLQISAVQALLHLTKVCKQRIYIHLEDVLAALIFCWDSITNKETNDFDIIFGGKVQKVKEREECQEKIKILKQEILNVMFQIMSTHNKEVTEFIENIALESPNSVVGLVKVLL
ncbi:hypothetical protein BB558_000005 [Smittium angustum]|uniref:Uncharacterized protein n=1 Tax=Smittium angustum TaxID=133377 RepID=A0A2U1JFR7_SMIAN|nr:hypothetical protein BB558_000005 [Smittium angustum]